MFNTVRDMFNGRRNDGQQTQQQQPNQQQPNQQQQPASLDTTDPNAAPGNQNVHPLDGFKDLFAPNKPANQQGDANQPAQPQQVAGGPETPRDYFNINREQFSKAMASVNPSQGVPPELMQKALGGDQQSLIDVINSVARNTLMYSVELNSRLGNQALNSGFTELNGSFDSRMRDFTSRDALYSKDEFKHPALRETAELVRSQLARKFPDATANEIEGKVREYLKGVGSLFSDNQPAGGDQAAAAAANAAKTGNDFTEWF